MKIWTWPLPRTQWDDPSLSPIVDYWALGALITGFPPIFLLVEILPGVELYSCAPRIPFHFLPGTSSSPVVVAQMPPVTHPLCDFAESSGSDSWSPSCSRACLAQHGALANTAQSGLGRCCSDGVFPHSHSAIHAQAGLLVPAALLFPVKAIPGPADSQLA